MSSSVWFVELKWAGTGRSFLPLITSLRCSRKRSANLRPVSPIRMTNYAAQDFYLSIFNIQEWHHSIRLYQQSECNHFHSPHHCCFRFHRCRLPRYRRCHRLAKVHIQLRLGPSQSCLQQISSFREANKMSGNYLNLVIFGALQLLVLSMHGV